MVTISDFIVLILTCSTFLPCLTAECLSGLQSAGLCAAFNIILPSIMGIGSHLFERSFLRYGGNAYIRNINHERESSRLLNMAALASLSVLSWHSMKHIAHNPTRVAMVLFSSYAYSHGRAFFMNQQSRLLRTTSYMLPLAIGLSTIKYYKI